MSMKHFKAYTPSRRNMTVSDYAEVTKKTPEKSLLAKKKKNAGRNSYGRITVRHQGGGNRQKYRKIDFKRIKDDMEATVVEIEYDPNRSANIALIKYEDGTLNFFSIACFISVLLAELATLKAYLLSGSIPAVFSVIIGAKIISK